MTAGWRCRALALAAAPLAGALPAPAAEAPFASGGAALLALERRLGAAPARLMRVLVYPSFVEIEAQDPKQPMHVDRFRYEDDRLSDPEPVQVGRKRREVEARLFVIAEPALARLPSLLPEALARVKTEAGSVSHVVIERGQSSGEVSSWGRPRIQVFVLGPRGGGYAEFGTDGKRRRVARW